MPFTKTWTDGQAYKGAPDAPLTHFLRAISGLSTSAIQQLSAVKDAQKNRDIFPSTDGKVLRGWIEIISQFEGYCKQKFYAVKSFTSESWETEAVASDDCNTIGFVRRLIASYYSIRRSWGLASQCLVRVHKFSEIQLRRKAPISA